MHTCFGCFAKRRSKLVNLTFRKPKENLIFNKRGIAPSPFVENYWMALPKVHSLNTKQMHGRGHAPQNKPFIFFSTNGDRANALLI